MINKVVSLNKGGTKYSVISALQEHIDEIEDLVVIVQWKEGSKVQLCNTAMSLADLAWFSAYLSGKLDKIIFDDEEW